TGVQTCALPISTRVSKSAIRARPRLRSRMKQTCTRLVQHVRGLAEGEPDEVPSQIATREEGRSGHAGNPDVAHEPLRECDVIVETKGTDIAEHVVRALRCGRAEARIVEDPHERTATSEIFR